MKIRITQPGMENFSGLFGPIEFKDGISTRDLLPIEVARISGAVRCETLDGVNPSPAQQLVDEQVRRMTVPVTVSVPVKEDEKLAQSDVRVYTREDLEKIADEKGITGLREIGDSLDVKSNSIVKLIEAILGAQGARQA